MGKIKVKLTTGVEEEKSVISAFKVGSDSFVVFDSESMGSMGLPIILVSKLDESKISKVNDQNEWQKTKEYLKLIIGNAQMEYIVVPSLLNAEEIFYTQLTLPQASFDAIKNNYKPVPGGSVAPNSIVEEVPFVPNIEVTPIAPVIPATPGVVPVMEPIAPVTPATPGVVPVIEPISPVIPAAPEVAPVIEPIAPVTPTAPEVVPVIEPIAPVIPATPEVVPVIPATPGVVPVMEPIAPVIQAAPGVVPVMEPIAPVIPAAPEVVPVMEPIAPVIPATPEVAPVMEPIASEDKYKDMKEAFMKSCENMFEALVKQFENKE